MQNERCIWFNGSIVPLGKVTINALSPTAQFGANVFEGIRCYWNAEKSALQVFRLEEHFDRLERSLKMFRIASPVPRSEWRKAIIDVIKANGYREDLAIRQTIFVDGTEGSWFSSSPTGMFIAPIPRARKPIPLTKGITCCVSSWGRINDRTLSPKIKVGANYINSRMAQIEATTNGYDSAIMMNQLGLIAEGPGSCFFMVRDGKLITPPVWASILESITRNSLLTLGHEYLGFPIEERPIDRTELYICDEAFFCGSAAEITPIISIDGYPVGNGKPGDITISLHKSYIQAAEGKLPHYESWTSQLC